MEDNRYERAARELAKVLDIPISPDIDPKRAKWGDAYVTLAQHARSYNVPIPASVTDIIGGKTEDVPAVKDISAWLQAHSYTATEAADVAGRLHAHPDTRLALRELVESGTEPMDLTVAGVSYQSLRTRQWMTPVNALLTLAWLKVDPNEAKKALKEGIR